MKKMMMKMVITIWMSRDSMLHFEDGYNSLKRDSKDDNGMSRRP